jgi:predicted PurR-regulated permease PerM
MRGILCPLITAAVCCMSLWPLVVFCVRNSRFPACDTSLCMCVYMHVVFVLVHMCTFVNKLFYLIKTRYNESCFFSILLTSLVQDIDITLSAVQCCSRAQPMFDMRCIDISICRRDVISEVSALKRDLF